MQSIIITSITVAIISSLLCILIYLLTLRNSIFFYENFDAIFFKRLRLNNRFGILIGMELKKRENLERIVWKNALLAIPPNDEFSIVFDLNRKSINFLVYHEDKNIDAALYNSFSLLKKIIKTLSKNISINYEFLTKDQILDLFPCDLKIIKKISVKKSLFVLEDDNEKVYYIKISRYSPLQNIALKLKFSSNSEIREIFVLNYKKPKDPKIPIKVNLYSIAVAGQIQSLENYNEEIKKEEDKSYSIRDFHKFLFYRNTKFSQKCTIAQASSLAKKVLEVICKTRTQLLASKEDVQEEYFRLNQQPKKTIDRNQIGQKSKLIRREEIYEGLEKIMSLIRGEGLLSLEKIYEKNWFSKNEVNFYIRLLLKTKTIKQSQINDLKAPHKKIPLYYIADLKIDPIELFMVRKFIELCEDNSIIVDESIGSQFDAIIGNRYLLKGINLQKYPENIWSQLIDKRIKMTEELGYSALIILIPFSEKIKIESLKRDNLIVLQFTHKSMYRLITEIKKSLKIYITV